MGDKKKGSLEGARIRRLRLRAQLTQEGLARRVGVTVQTIWRLENAPTFSPRIHTLRAIAKELGVDVSYFLKD